MNLFKRLWLRLREWGSRPRKLVRVEGDAFPEVMPPRDFVLLSEEGEAWSIGLTCPCGCAQFIELPLIAEASPRWRLEIDDAGLPTLAPSVWLRIGCRSHFFVKEGKVVWV